MMVSASSLAVGWVMVLGLAPRGDIEAPDSDMGSVTPEEIAQGSESKIAAPTAGGESAEPTDELSAPPPSAAEPSELENERPSPPEPTEPLDDEDGSTAEELVPAPLPEDAPSPPDDAETAARGGAILTPLPPAPEPEDPSTLREGPWRGRGWLGLGLAASIPVGGSPPAAGTVVAAAGEVTIGWRINRVIALHTALSTYAHDAERRTVIASDGTSFDEVANGRITAFDLVTVRAFLPLPRRIEPWAELGVGVGARRDAFATRRDAAGLARAGLGVDFWLAPTFSLGAMTAYRLAIIDDSLGHGLRVGVDLGIHW